VPLQGNIGVLCNGTGLTMATLDLIHKAKGKSASFVDIGGEYRHNCPPETLQERLECGLDLLLEDKQVKAILINLLGSVSSGDQIAEMLAQYLSQKSRSQTLPPIVLRLVGDRIDEAVAILVPHKVPVVESLADAIAKTVMVAQHPVIAS
jgi:succinyl-CoA synthetase beta subunit